MLILAGLRPDHRDRRPPGSIRLEDAMPLIFTSCDGRAALLTSAWLAAHPANPAA
jgi:hypothetical protein